MVKLRRGDCKIVVGGSNESGGVAILKSHSILSYRIIVGEIAGHALISR